MATKVSESTGYTGNLEMSALGYAMAAILVIVMAPLLPVFAVAWVIWRVFGPEEAAVPRFEAWRAESDRSPSDA